MFSANEGKVHRDFEVVRTELLGGSKDFSITIRFETADALYKGAVAVGELSFIGLNVLVETMAVAMSKRKEYLLGIRFAMIASITYDELTDVVAAVREIPGYKTCIVSVVK